MRSVSIRWLLLGVAGISLVVPVIAILSLRSFDAVLIRQTERELNVQAALVAAAYQEAWALSGNVPAGNPRDRVHSTNTFIPLTSLVYDLDAQSPPFPEDLPLRQNGLTARETSIGVRLSSMLQNAQVYTLSGARVLAPDGCAIASSRAQIGVCFDRLPEVHAALRGRAAGALRARVSDEPAPALSSFSRRGETRVFVARPVWNDGQIIGAVWLSRTAESGLEWLFKRRKGIFFGGLVVLVLTVLTSVAFSWFITRPLSKMSRLLRDGESSARLSEVSAPREIHALGVALDERAQQLERKNRYIAEFAANISHELKTPLTSIRGAVELLQDGGDMPSAQRERFLANIDAATERTERLVTRLLYLARLESPQTDGESDLVEVHRYLAALKTRYGSDIHLNLYDQRLDETAPLLISETALEAVFVNLIDNALRHRREKPVQVEVTLLRPREDSTKLYVEVTDDGPGISRENQRRLFERFFTTERDRGGTGLGLSIVQATAERRGGRAAVESGPEGTVARVWM